MDAPMASRPQDRMMQARQPVAPQEVPQWGKPESVMEMLEYIDPQTLDSISWDDAKNLLVQLVAEIQWMKEEAPEGWPM